MSKLERSIDLTLLSIAIAHRVALDNRVTQTNKQFAEYLIAISDHDDSDDDTRALS